VHRLEEMQETRLSEPAVTPGGLGTDCRVQVVPFQLSATSKAVPLVFAKPVASHAVDEAHDTPSRNV
jgi:hypothetical protein